MLNGVRQTTIPLSGTISGNIDLTKGPLRAIYIPTITSGDMFVRGSFDQTSANFGRIQYPIFGAPTSGDLRLPVGPGSCMVLWPDNLPSPNWIRLETAAIQLSATSLSIRFGNK